MTSNVRSISRRTIEITIIDGYIDSGKGAAHIITHKGDGTPVSEPFISAKLISNGLWIFLTVNGRKGTSLEQLEAVVADMNSTIGRDSGKYFRAMNVLDDQYIEGPSKAIDPKTGQPYFNRNLFLFLDQVRVLPNKAKAPVSTRQDAVAA